MAIRFLLILLCCHPVLSQTNIKLLRSVDLPRAVSETSGLETWNGQLITHNDSGKPPSLFTIDTLTGEVVSEFRIPAKNHDWEDIAQDENYFYLADVGNNAHARFVLKIYRIEKKSLSTEKIGLDTIFFSWGKIDKDGKQRVCNFNCEAVVCSADSLFLFTKEKHRTAVFSIPNKPGSYTALYKSEFRHKNFFATGAWYDPKSKRLVICGYNNRLRTFLYDFSGFEGTDFFSVKPKRYRFPMALRQTEGIASFDGVDFYISSEMLYLPVFVHRKPQLYLVKMQ